MFKESQIYIKIGNDQRHCLKDISEDWIVQQIAKRQRDYHDVCVRVILESQTGTLTFPTSPCASGGGSSRQLDRDEAKAWDIWVKFGLNQAEFNHGNLIAFLKQITQ